MLKLAIIFAIVAVYYVDAQYVRYFLHTRNNVDVPEILSPFGGLPPNTFLNRQHKTIVLIHGHAGNQLSRFNTLVKNAILSKEPANVIVLDWEFDAQFSYIISAKRIIYVAYSLEAFMTWLDDMVGVDPRTLHLVGFDLGAHIAGTASRWFGALHSLNSTVGRITGLDPAGPEFHDSMGLVLTNHDADYVEVIHTDGSGPQALGIGRPVGSINFYANGGTNQPGCSTHACNHDRAYELFAATMTNPNLVGLPCMSMDEVELNLCRGYPLRMGGTAINKWDHPSTLWWIYRINTGSVYPF